MSAWAFALAVAAGCFIAAAVIVISIDFVTWLFTAPALPGERADGEDRT